MSQFAEYPFIISNALRLYQEDIEKEQYKSALLSLRDIGESIIKFYSITLFSDAFEQTSQIHNKHLIENLLTICSKLFQKPPTLGDWLHFYFDTAKLLRKEDYEKNLVFPEILSLVSRGKRIQCNSKEAKVFREFVKWRNDSIGHGRIGNNVASIKSGIQHMYNQLSSILESSHPYLKDLEIYSINPTDSKHMINWNQDQLTVYSSQPQTDWDYSVWIKRQSNNSSFSISPLIISKFSSHSPDSGVYSLLTFDKIGRGYIFLDCFYGSKVKFLKLPILDNFISSLEEMGRLKLMDEFSDKDLLNTSKTTYSKKLVESFDLIEFGSDIKAKFINPKQQIKAIQSEIENLEKQSGKGYIHIVGGAGIGKSWMAHALQSNKYFPFSKDVIKYHVRLGMRQNPEIFIGSLCDQISKPQGHNVQTRIPFEKFNTKREAITHFFQEVLDQSHQDSLIIVIDGLDELLDADDSIIDYLPFADDLPDNVFIVLLSREDQELRSQSLEFIQLITDSPWYSRLTVDPITDERKQLFQDYLTQKCTIKDPDMISNFINTSRGSFLMLSLLSKLYKDQKGLNQLPSTIDEAYQNHLLSVQQSAGSSIFEKLYLKVLLVLAASPSPLNLNKISDLSGVTEEKVVFTLYDIGHFFHVHREKNENLFTISHLKFIEYLLMNYKEELKIILSEIMLYPFNDPELISWMLESNKKFQSLGATELSIHLSELLLSQLTKGTEDWLNVMYSYIDMIHITGDYLKAAQMYNQLTQELLDSYGYQKDSTLYLKYKIREAHHLKFVATIDQPDQILTELLSNVDASHDLYDEIRFGKYGSIGCLKNPNSNTLDQLLDVAHQARKRNDMNLYVKCLRRSADLCLITGKVAQGENLVKEAIEIAETLHSRQRIYLYSTTGEYGRRQNNLQESLVNHTSTRQYAEKLGLNGWSGHGALGVAETYRMMGQQEKALQFIDVAFDYYKKASNQPWGIVHTLIAKYLLLQDINFIESALEISKEKGYQYEIDYLTKLKNKKTIHPTDHNDHFLLFP